MLYKSDGRRYCRRLPDQCYLPKVMKPVFKKERQSVIVWDCITIEGVGKLLLDRNQKATDYIETLEGLLGTFEDLGSTDDDIKFQQDGAKIHITGGIK